MLSILRNTAIVFLGIILGMIFNMGIVYLGGYILETPVNFSPMNATNWDLKYFVFPFLAHASGTFSGSYLVSKISKNSSFLYPLIVGIYFLAGGIYMTTIITAPFWFVILDLGFAYVPMSILAWRLSE